MSPHEPASTESISITFTNSTMSGSAMAAGAHSSATVTPVSAAEATALDAASALRQELQKVQEATDRRDDETRERLELAAGRLTALEEELKAERAKRDRGRLKKLATGIRDALTGLTSLTVSANALWDAVETISR